MVGMKAKFAAGAAKIFAAFGDVIESVDYISMGDQSYNPSTEEITRTDITLPSIQMVQGKLSGDVMDRLGGGTDRSKQPTMYFESLVGIFLTAELTVEPKSGDTMTRANSSVWNVVDYFNDPAEATWTILFRK